MNFTQNRVFASSSSHRLDAHFLCTDNFVHKKSPVAHKEALLDSSSPLMAFAHQQIRFLFRATQVYGVLLKETLQPKYMQDGVDYSIALDILCKPHLKFETKPHYWALLEAEKQALTQANIPLFNVRTDSEYVFPQLAPHQNCLSTQ